MSWWGVFFRLFFHEFVLKDFFLLCVPVYERSTRGVHTKLILHTDYSCADCTGPSFSCYGAESGLAGQDVDQD